MKALQKLLRSGGSPIESELLTYSLVLSLLSTSTIAFIAFFQNSIQGFFYLAAMSLYAFLFAWHERVRRTTKIAFITYLYTAIFASIGIVLDVYSVFFQGVLLSTIFLSILVLEKKYYAGFFALLLTVVSITLLLGHTMVNFEESYDRLAWLNKISGEHMVMSLLMVGLAVIVKRQLSSHQAIQRKLLEELTVERTKTEKIEHAKSTFLANFSHELRTPLNGIVGSKNLLIHTTLDQHQKEIVKNLEYSSDRLNGLISDVLDITMLESGGISLEENVFNLHDTISGVLNIHAKGAKEHLFRMEEDVPAYVCGDEDRTKRVLAHLIKNTRETRDGFFKFNVILTSSFEDKLAIRFEIEQSKSVVSKTNCGQKTEDLGVSILQKLSEAMEGHVGMRESKENKFHYVEIPFMLPKVKNIANRNLSDLKVLIAEDQQINQLITRKMLENLGINNVEIVENGLEAVEKHSSTEFDLILMDLKMPLMDGIQATKEILYSGNGHKPLVIALTANAREIDRETCINAGMYDYINKPFSKEILYNSIQGALEQKGY